MHMNKYFEENLKRIFSDDDIHDTFFCTVPGATDSPVSGVKDGFLTITRDEMKALFDPVISKVVHLVEQQIRSVEALHRKVTVRYEQWTAVARGACQRGLEGLSIVRSHIAKRSYGVLCVRTMLNASGNPENTYICPHTKEMKILNRVTWLVKKGDQISSDKVMSFPFLCRVALDHNMIFENTFLACGTPYTPRNARNRTVFTVCKLSTDLNVVPRHMFEDQKKFNGDGEPYYLIQFNLTIKIQTALVFSFVFKGKEYSSVTPEWTKGLNV
ncbi:hypothetical protein Q9L58_004718 [Maublancomyces gigas]|uniref:Uncharacterized protein n=1 Tax=Discina gigas TaxID=1032678 RepID=A0ABR3GK01_9PEZI